MSAVHNLPPELMEAGRMLLSLEGATIVSADMGDGGLYFFLEDGRMIVISGQYLISVLKSPEVTTH
ncbi:MAG: hypothetical protein FJ143_02530 [Deltaproteobacteria bacterium]|nr:hypothetical protein [Deltaproteobacteria bacterium]